MAWRNFKSLILIKRQGCKMPQGSQPIAILCIGHVAEFYSRPMLELENWAQGHALEDFVSENYWPD
jgi:5,6-dimethylbenzimidazole synthase